MHLEQIIDRLDVLTLILKYAQIKDLAFTAGEKICINQERAMLYRKKAFLLGDCQLEEIPKYVLPETIENKIAKMLNTIELSGWTPKKTKNEP